MDGLYLREKCLLIDTIIKYQPREQSAKKLKNRTEKIVHKQKKGRYIHALSKRSCFVNKTTRTSRATSNTSNSNFNANIPQWNGARSSNEEDIGMSKCRRKSNADIKN